MKKCVQNESLQYQALDRNFQFDHYISNSSKPDDMDDELWQKGFNLDHNILAMYATPFGSITSWMNEGYSLSNGTWDTTGHRMALISPQYSSVQLDIADMFPLEKYVKAGIPDTQSLFQHFRQQVICLIMLCILMNVYGQLI